MKKRELEKGNRELKNIKKTKLFDDGALLTAYESNDICDFKKALENGANPNIIVNDHLLVTHIVLSNQKEMLEALIEHKPNLNLLNESGTSCLDYATIHTNKEIIKLLVSNGAGFTMQTKSDNMFFGYVYKNDVEMIRFLLENGIESKIFTPEKDTAINIAIKNENIEMLETLLSYGMKADFKAPSQNTALIYSIKNANIEIVKILMQHGANYMLKDKKGLSAIELARKIENQEIVDLISSYIDLDTYDTKDFATLCQGSLIDINEIKDLF